MRAGKLDRRLILQREIEAGRNEYNEPIVTWAKFATVWGQARPNRGAERFDAAKVSGSAVTTYHIRYRDDLRVTDRILYQGKAWNITDIRELGRNVGLEFDCIASLD